MPKQQYFGNLAFEDNFVFAYTSNQEKIKFSRHERALLKNFISQPGKLLTRSLLLDYVQQTGTDTDTFDRNIDYLVSRLRRKLGDSANSPQYIATQYGEGYIWIAKAYDQLPDTSKDIYLSIGPIYGLAQAIKINGTANSFVNDLIKALRNNFDAQQRIELLPDQTSGECLEGKRLHYHASYAVELIFLDLNQALRCTLVALNRKSGQVFGTFRYVFPTAEDQDNAEKSVAHLATAIKNKIWDAQIFRDSEQISISSDCIAVGMYKASRLFEPGKDNFVHVEEKLRDQLRKHPDDHATALLLATNIHGQIYAGNFDQLEDKEKEIKLLIIDHLPYIQNDALYLSAAADRLHSLGHTELAENLAERALETGASFAACFMVLGRIKVSQGSILEGIAYYERSLEMTEKDSTFFLLLQIMKCVAYKALSDQENVRKLVPYIISMEPDEFKKIALQMLFLAGDPQVVSSETTAIAATIPKEIACHSLMLLYYTCGKHFDNEIHRENLLGGIVNLFVELHGESIVSDVIQQGAPALFAKQEILNLFKGVTSGSGRH